MRAIPKALAAATVVFLIPVATGAQTTSAPLVELNVHAGGSTGATFHPGRDVTFLIGARALLHVRKRVELRR